jgi:hypothetical protein
VAGRRIPELRSNAFKLGAGSITASRGLCRDKGTPSNKAARGEQSRHWPIDCHIHDVRIDHGRPDTPARHGGACDRHRNRRTQTVSDVTSALQTAVERLSEAIATAREPGKPLSTISAITREAPLASLFVAFLFGVAVARRH